MALRARHPRFPSANTAGHPHRKTTPAKFAPPISPCRSRTPRTNTPRRSSHKNNLPLSPPPPYPRAAPEPPPKTRRGVRAIKIISHFHHPPESDGQLWRKINLLRRHAAFGRLQFHQPATRAISRAINQILLHDRSDDDGGA